MTSSDDPSLLFLWVCSGKRASPVAARGSTAAPRKTILAFLTDAATNTYQSPLSRHLYHGRSAAYKLAFC
ncbi:hypothetical protein BDV09DRAFT_164562, partial [Aspergillus tetrazonus]